jgi:hypothetical protein
VKITPPCQSIIGRIIIFLTFISLCGAVWCNVQTSQTVRAEFHPARHQAGGHVRETRGVQQAAGERERTAGAYRTGQCFLLFCYYSIHSFIFHLFFLFFLILYLCSDEMSMVRILPFNCSTHAFN